MAKAIKKQQEVEVEEPTLTLSEKFVFMDKAIAILDVGLKTEKNVVLYGPGGHGKSELALEFFAEKGIYPYVITMGSGMTADRMFGGLNIPLAQTKGKIEYLVENSFMNHEYVIFEEMMDAPDYILEMLKDILSSGLYRNGSQIYPIRTKYIVACTNKTREEFSKNDSLRALMERFPLELNVIWDNYTEIAYTKLLENRFGEGIEPVIPFILEEYNKQGITISPRVAIDAYEVYGQCGPDSLKFIADFNKKATVITDGLSKYHSSIKFKDLAKELEAMVDQINELAVTDKDSLEEFTNQLGLIGDKFTDIKALPAQDSIASIQTALIKNMNNQISKLTNYKLDKEAVFYPPLDTAPVRDASGKFAPKTKKATSAKASPWSGEDEEDDD